MHVDAEEQVLAGADSVRVQAIAPLPPPRTRAATGPCPSTYLPHSGLQGQRSSRREKPRTRLHLRRTSFRLPCSSKRAWRELEGERRPSWWEGCTLKSGLRRSWRAIRYRPRSGADRLLFV